MKHISEIALQQPLATVTDKPEPRQSELDDAAQKVVVALFRELKAIFPAWKQAWPTADEETAARRSWIKAFASAGLRDIEQIRFGVERCRTLGRPFMPSVGEFIQWCKPSAEMLGCPSVESAYLQACAMAHPSAADADAHPVVQHAARETGFYLLARMPETASKPVFERAYALALEMYARGEPMRELAKALPAKVSTPADPERVRAALEQMRKTLRRAS